MICKVSFSSAEIRKELFRTVTKINYSEYIELFVEKAVQGCREN